MRAALLLPCLVLSLYPACSAGFSVQLPQSHRAMQVGSVGPFRPPAREQRTSAAVPSMRQNDSDDESFKPPAVFSIENAGPWAILLVVLIFEGLATLPRETLPEPVAALIPLVLGEQYGVPRS